MFYIFTSNLFLETNDNIRALINFSSNIFTITSTYTPTKVFKYEKLISKLEILIDQV